MTENFAEIEKTLRPANYSKLVNRKVSYVGLGPQAYFEFIKMLDDDYLTDWEAMKMRLLFREMWRKSFTIPVGLFAVYWLSFNRIMGIYTPRPQMYRAFKTSGVLLMTAFSYWFLNSFNVGSKYFHELITQPEPNGKYLREAMRINMPRHWSLMSKQLYEQGYNFREMNEYHDRTIIPDPDNKHDTSYY